MLSPVAQSTPSTSWLVVLLVALSLLFLAGIYLAYFHFGRSVDEHGNREPVQWARGFKTLVLYAAIAVLVALVAGSL